MRIKRLTSFLVILCLLMALPCLAFAEGESDFEGKSWDDVIQTLLTKYGAEENNVALGYINLVTGEEHYYNGDKYMVSGSMFKVPLNMYYARMVSQGEMDWDTLVYGVKYEWLMEDSIVNSNNDYAEILWRNLGQGNYNSYRRAIAPLMGEDADTVDYKFYENNFFTPQQMIYCLKLLYDQQEQFPRIIETMQQAEPENYFKLHENRFDIAHKYGFLQEEYHAYVNDCGLAFTDDPIAIVIFTDNAPKAYELITEYCTLMCDYTQYNTALRLDEERAAEERAAAERAAAESAAPVETEPVEAAVTPAPGIKLPAVISGMGGGALILCAVIALLTLVAALLALVKGGRGRFSRLWAVLGAIFAGAAILAAVLGANLGTVYMITEGDPAPVAAEFMDALTAGDYDKACACLNGYSSLGLETAPENPVGQKLYTALKASYGYEMVGQCEVNKLEASQTVSFTYLDLPSMEGDVEARTMEVLEDFVSTRPRRELYDENNNYLPAVAQEAYSTALEETLANASSYYKTIETTLHLVYGDEGWKIEAPQELFKALAGGVS